MKYLYALGLGYLASISFCCGFVPDLPKDRAGYISLFVGVVAMLFVLGFAYLGGEFPSKEEKRLAQLRKENDIARDDFLNRLH